MELNVTIDIDWIDENNSIDEIVKSEIIRGIMNQIGNKLKEDVTKKVESKIDNLIVKKVNSLTDKMFKDFTKRTITLSDGYGDKLKVYNSLRDLMKEKFDKFMIQTVDEKGNAYDGNYGKKYKRVEFIIDQQLKEFANKFTTDTVKKVSEEIKLHVSDGLKNKLGAELMTVLKVDKMLQIKS